MHSYGVGASPALALRTTIKKLALLSRLMKFFFFFMTMDGCRLALFFFKWCLASQLAIILPEVIDGATTTPSGKGQNRFLHILF